jgi:diacylglycerol kinase family enzyme
VVIIKKISISEIFKMRFTKGDLNPEKTELLQTSSLRIRSKRKTHFQVDGEYRGKLRDVKAEIVPKALKVIVSSDTNVKA